MTDLDQRLGLSTLALQGLSLERAIDLTEEAGLRVFELTPHLYGGPQHFTNETRARLKERLASFSSVTVHTSEAALSGGRVADLGSPDPEFSGPSRDLYLAHVQLALDIGAEVVTFHPAGPERLALRCQDPVPHLELGRLALELVGDREIKLGYEFFDTELVASLDDPRFGLLFDLGHAAFLSSGQATANVLELMAEALPLTVEYHLHGVEIAAPGQKRDHLPFRRSNALDYDRVAEAINRSGFEGPLVLEIGAFNPGQPQENLKDCLRAKADCLAAVKRAQADG